MITNCKDDWYRSRILWKAEQHNLFTKKCCKFSDLSDNAILTIKNTVSQDINPVIVFWNSEKKWTVLGTKAICSFYDNEFIMSELDDIDKQLSLFHPAGTKIEDAKLKSNFIRLDKSGKLIWVPAGPELFALMNILNMFPLLGSKPN